jgi:c-di-GMP-binding flagellar brake protein YcgR
MYKDYTGPERRKSKRVEVNFTVTYKIHQPPSIVMMVGGKEVYAVMLDLSKDGMSIITEYEIPVKTVLYIKFTLINLGADDESRTRNMEMMGTVKHIRPYEKKDFRMGIEFSDLSQENKDFLDEFARETKE